METPLKAARIAKNLTLEQLADEVDCHHAHLSRVENGGKCSPELAERLVAALGKGRITELKILYPERYMTGASA